MFLEEHTAQQMEDVGSWIKWKSFVVWWGWRRWSLLLPISNSNQEWKRLLQRSARKW
jgi:hypothetical protein